MRDCKNGGPRHFEKRQVSDEVNVQTTVAYLFDQPCRSRGNNAVLKLLDCRSNVGRVTCQSPLLKAPPTKSPLKSGRCAMGRKYKSPPRQAPPKKLRRLINRRLLRRIKNLAVLHRFLPREAQRSAVLPRQVFCLSICPAFLTCLKLFNFDNNC